jgi:hypothetical protein
MLPQTTGVACRLDAVARLRTETAGAAETRSAAPVFACIDPEAGGTHTMIVRSCTPEGSSCGQPDNLSNLVRALLPHERLVARRALAQVAHVRLAHDTLQLPQPDQSQRHAPLIPRFTRTVPYVSTGN